jgi:hypothetical protein
MDIRNRRSLCNVTEKQIEAIVQEALAIYFI